jgi:hypothetical protein
MGDGYNEEPFGTVKNSGSIMLRRKILPISESIGHKSNKRH